MNLHNIIVIVSENDSSGFPNVLGKRNAKASVCFARNILNNNPEDKINFITSGGHAKTNGGIELSNAMANQIRIYLNDLISPNLHKNIKIISQAEIIKDNLATDTLGELKWASSLTSTLKGNTYIIAPQEQILRIKLISKINRFFKSLRKLSFISTNEILKESAQVSTRFQFTEIIKIIIDPSGQILSRISSTWPKLKSKIVKITNGS